MCLGADLGQLSIPYGNLPGTGRLDFRGAICDRSERIVRHRTLKAKCLRKHRMSYTFLHASPPLLERVCPWLMTAIFK